MVLFRVELGSRHCAYIDKVQPDSDRLITNSWLVAYTERSWELVDFSVNCFEDQGKRECHCD